MVRVKSVFSVARAAAAYHNIARQTRVGHRSPARRQRSMRELRDDITLLESYRRAQREADTWLVRFTAATVALPADTRGENEVARLIVDSHTRMRQRSP